jgi:hypothetical protein
MPFRLWPAQARVLWSFLTGTLFIILKARQLGISWICCGYALWLCLFQPGKQVLIFSKGQLEANELMRRIVALYDRLPDWLREATPQMLKNNTEIVEWQNGSRIRALSSKGGRSFTASLVILDEAAFLDQASELYMALKPTIDAGGQLIVLSTANGLGNLFHRLWVAAESGKNQFVAIFLPWWARPSRTAEWYERQKLEYSDPAMVQQEYPQTAREAFVASGRVRFLSEWILRQESGTVAPVAIPNTLQPLGASLVVYSHRTAGRRYVIGADVAEGGQAGDYSVAVIIDRDSWEEVATYSAHVEPDVFAMHLHLLSGYYIDDGGDGALIAPERNNHGHAVMATLKTKNLLSRVWRDKAGKLGWLTTAQSKPAMIDLLAEALRDNLVKIHSTATLAELQIYAIGNDGDTNAPSGYHDDRVMALAIALSVARGRRQINDVW